MPQLIENGNLYIARPPLFKIKRGKDEIYLSDEQSLQNSLIDYGLKDLRFKTALNTEFSGEQLSEILLKISEIVDIFNKVPVRYDKKVLEQIAISGCLDTNKFSENQNNIKEAVNYISQRINISRPDYDRGWKGNFIEGGFKFTRELRGIDDNIVIDKDLLNSQLIENLNKNYVDIFQMFEMPGMVIKKDDIQIEIFSPSQLLEIVNENGKKGLSLQRYKGLGEMNPEQLWDCLLYTSPSPRD